MSTSTAEQLGNWRVIGARRSEEAYESCIRALKAGGLGQEEWSVREQLAIAALDLGRSRAAQAQIDVLNKRFPKSPRVMVLRGMLLEVKGDIERATQLYGSLIQKDETNVAAHQRLISLTLSTPSAAIPALLRYLDIFYTDPNAWSLLADLYAELGLYAQSLTALEHVMLMQSWDSAVVCRAGETAYTVGDYPLALKYFLRSIELATDSNRPQPGSESKNSRSWWGVKLTTRRLMDQGRTSVESSVPNEMTTTPNQLKALDELATEMILAVGGAGLPIKRTVLGDISSKARR